MPYPVLDWAGGSDAGLKRGRNEDAFKTLVPPSDAAQHALGALFMVADGMGGLRGGELASASALEAVIRDYYGPLDSAETSAEAPVERLRDAIETANVHVRQQAARAGLDRIGTTLAGLVILDDEVGILFNVGDSRVYRFRHNTTVQITDDQSLAAQQRQSATTQTVTGRASTSITAFLGQPFPLEPCIEQTEIRRGDVYLLCTDGLWSLFEPHEMARIIKRNSAEQTVRKLIAAARKRGAPDNVTAVVVSVGGARRGKLGLVVLVALLGVLALVTAALLLV